MNNTSVVAELKTRLNPIQLLDHPWYRAWECGHVSRDALGHYAGQYYHHVSAFPRYVSATHSQIESIETRQALLENLIDEERGSEHHPELWLRFAEAMGEDREQVRTGSIEPATRALIDAFLGAARSSAAEGLGALYAYESQVPRIAEFKLEALKRHYGCAGDERATKFFDVHRIADQHHTQSLEQAIEALPAEERERCATACERAGRALWGFLDSMSERYPMHAASA